MPKTARKASSPQAESESEGARLTDPALTPQDADRSRLEDALHESEDRFRSLFENTIYGVLLTAPDGSVLAANPEACRLLGRTEEEICTAGYTGIFDSSDPWVAARLDHLQKLADAGLAEMRVTLLGLQPEVLVAGGLVKGLEHLAELLRDRYELNVETRFGAEPDVSGEAKLALYRIAQEATNNVGKHAQAKNVTINLASDERAVTLEISDDGRGFAPAGSFPGRFGLKTMQERAGQIGATWEIASDAGSGTRVSVRLPPGERDPV